MTDLLLYSRKQLDTANESRATSSTEASKEDKPGASAVAPKDDAINKMAV